MADKKYKMTISVDVKEVEDGVEAGFNTISTTYENLSYGDLVVVQQQVKKLAVNLFDLGVAEAKSKGLLKDVEALLK